MISSNVWQRRGFPRRLVWSLLASMAINFLLCLTVYPHLSFPREAPEKQIRALAIRIEHRLIPQRDAVRKPPLIPHPPIETKPRLRPRNNVQTKLPPPHARPLPLLVPRSHTRKHPPSRVHPRAGGTALDPQHWSGNLTFTPHQSGALNLPSSWAVQDNGDAAAANMTVWMDFKKARGAFVPQVMLWHVNAAFLSGPSLHNAIDDIVGSLRSEGAKVYVSKAQRVCGGKRLGWFLAYEKPNGDPPWQFEDTLYMAGDTVYRATYSRPGGQAEDKKTRAALDTLCPRS